jgi:Regulator of Chromosome Condensation (RCC1) repeat protein
MDSLRCRSSARTARAGTSSVRRSQPVLSAIHLAKPALLTSRPQANPADANRADTHRPLANPAEASPAEASPAEASPADANRADANPPHANRADANPPSANRADAHRPHANRVDAHRRCAIPADANGADAHRTSANRADANRADAHSPRANPADANRADANPPRANRADAHRPCSNRADAHRAGGASASSGAALGSVWSAVLALLVLGCHNSPLAPGAAGIEEEAVGAAGAHTARRAVGAEPHARRERAAAAHGPSGGVTTAQLALVPAPFAMRQKGGPRAPAPRPHADASALASAGSSPSAAPHTAASTAGGSAALGAGAARHPRVAASSNAAPAELCVGSGHSCMRSSDGRVACWGDNSEHQVSTSDESQLERPRWVAELPLAASLRCGGAETCVRTPAGDVYCLGGEEGVEKLELGEAAVDLAESASGGCAALRDGRVMCWQQPALEPRVTGAAARRSPRTSRTPRAVAGMTVSHGFALAPALASRICTSTSRGPVCTSAPAASDGAAPVAAGDGAAPIAAGDGAAPAIAGNAAAAVTAGDGAVLLGASLAGASQLALVNRAGTMLCGLLGADRLRCAGDGAGRSLVASGELTLDASVMHPWGAPEEAAASPGFAGVVAVYEGGLCLRAPGGLLRCVGAPNELVANVPAEARSAAIGAGHACAMTEHDVYCWGAAGRGQLGSGPSYLHREPTAVPGIEDASAIAATETRACVLRASGQLWCWGEGATRGGGDSVDYAPRRVDAPEPLLELRTLPSAGALATRAVERRPGPARAEAAICARSASGWSCLGGRELEPQTASDRGAGDGPLLAGSSPLPQVARDGRCAVTFAGSLVCAVASGRAAPAHAPRPAPRRFETAEGFVEVTPVFSLRGVAHVCGRTRAGRVECFGLDDGESAAALAASDRAGALGLEALEGIVQLGAASSGGVACALDAAGAVWCWGSERWGQRPGAGAEAAPEQPTAIAGLPPIARVVVGSTSVCARAMDGRVFCWGSNRDGGAPDGAPGVAREAQHVQLPL